MKTTYTFYNYYPRSNQMHDMFRALRQLQNKTQRECADELGISYQQYQKYEYGLIKPKPKKLIKIAKFLGCEDMVLHWLQNDYKLKLDTELRHRLENELF